ncbi:protein Aatf [Drosophila tropicalis]|uniref:protein Aatf n=1 Tax=Drosophila tropicalis TaxID=46794 RepID=UPI0035ABCEFF
MLRKNKKQPQTVAEKVSRLLAHPNDSDSEEESDVDTSARLADFEPEEYDLPDARSTEFRKRNVKLLSEQSDKYKGKISSRKEMEDDELSYEQSDSDEEALAAFNKEIKSARKDVDSEDGDEDEEIEDKNEEEESDEDNEEEVDSEGDDDADSGDEDEDDSEEDEDQTDSINPSDIMSKTNHQAEMQKGLCVQNQLRIWERLLELRINTQKFTTKANQLPSPSTLKAIYSSPDHQEELQAVLSEAQERSSKLLQQLLALKQALTQQNSEHRQAVKRKSLPDDSEPPIKRFSSILQDNFQQSLNYRNEVLLKWDDRTKLLTPGAGLKRKSLQDDYDIIKKINSALANRQSLVEKSQIPKNNNQLTNPDEQKEPERQPHIYDDSDFYHQQLRELIEYKASSTSNMSEITKQFVELQKLRQKMKKKVDTRASKGRKLRYVVHNKLINFMAPNEASDWTDSSKTELYKSLFI